MSSSSRILAKIPGLAGPTEITLPAEWSIVDGALVQTLGAGLTKVGGALSSVAGRALSVYAAGTVYSLTNAAAAVVFGTTSPALAIDQAGTWLILSLAQLNSAAATIVAETATLKLRRTNNTPADLASIAVTISPPAVVTKTATIGSFDLPAAVYTTTNANDAIALYGSVSATLGAGTVDVVGASLVAIRLF